MEEEWRPIKNYEGLYEVSNLGRIKSLNKIIIDSKGREHKFKEKIMNLQYDRYGYLYVSLNKSGKKKFKVHRLVAEAFIPNPDNKGYVDHINTVKDDNRVENLRWVTSKENMNNELTKDKFKGVNNHMYGKKSLYSKKIIQLTLNGDFIKEWNSIKETKKYGYIPNNISDCCNKKRKTHKGYIWMFYEDYINNK